MRIKSCCHPSGRHSRVEMLESRLVLSANPLGSAIEHHAFDDSWAEGIALEHHALPPPEYWLELGDVDDTDQQLDNIEQLLASAHNLTGWTEVQTNYGFRGGGQTVAVIDSGIAYDHWALGGEPDGGLGPDYRVVGGWDFTEENDADPYDDGPLGSHGTHVAGIIGSSDDTNSGVAPDVDLVALRVFNDAGEGHFSWVEQALQWVYDNRNAFANPITTVNLSIGYDGWNSTSVPGWAMLEEELAALKSVGIVSVVLAGNSFATYDAPGLSYPAASPHVIPVMSVDDNGSMSFYSQRHTSAIAAPGRDIISTVPDYTGNQNGVTDDFASKTGTSMAAPYVAGASVLVREAMEFVGHTNIDQDTIYNHLMATADTFLDVATSTEYKRLNLASAINALMPDDEYGSTAATAYNLGTVSGTMEISGTINTLADADYFRFTADATGAVTFTASTTHSLAPVWIGSGTTSGANGETYTLEVVAGQSYTIGLSTDGGIGHFELAIDPESESTNNPPVLAPIGNRTVSEGSLLSFTASANDPDAGQTLTYSLASGAPAGATINATTGVFTWTPTESQGPGTFNVTVRVTDDGSPALSDSETITITVNEVNKAPVLAPIGNKSVNEGSLLSFTATATDADQPANSLTYSLAAGAPAGARINATTGVFTWTPTESQGPGTFNVTVRVTDNGSPALSDSETISITVKESFTFTNWGAIAQRQINDLTNSGTQWFRVQASQAGYLTAEAFAGGGNITIDWYDAKRQQVTSGSDVEGGQRVDVMVGAGQEFFLRVNGTSSDIDFRLTNLVSLSGTTMTVGGTSGADTFTFLAGASQHKATVNDVTYQFNKAEVSTINFNGGAGSDTITLTGTSGNETATLQKGSAQLNGSGYTTNVNSIGNITIFGGGGNDSVELYGTSSDDLYSVWSDRARMSGDGYFNEARHFSTTEAFAQGGLDRAHLYDTAGDDTYTARHDRVSMTGTGFSHEARGFDRTIGKSSAGNDTAVFHDTTGDDIFSAWWDHAVMYGNGYFNDTAGFDSTVAYASGGADQAFLYDSAGNDSYTAWRDRVLMQGNGFSNEAHHFDRTFAQATAGHNKATFVDSVRNDIFSSWSDHAVMYGPQYFNDTWGFDKTLAYSLYGQDQAFFNDSAGDDLFEAWSNRAVMKGAGYSNEARGFRRVTAFASGGFDQAILLDSEANDMVHVFDWGVYMTTPNAYDNEARGFDRIEALSTGGGTDRAFVRAVDYVFALIGGWRA